MAHSRLLKPNEIMFGLRYMLLGEGIAKFLQKNGVKKVVYIIDLNRKSLIIWGSTEEPNLISASHGYNKIEYTRITPRGHTRPSIIGHSRNVGGLVEMNVSEFRYYTAKPLNKHSFIIENVKLTNAASLVNKSHTIDMQNNIIYIALPDVAQSIKPEQLVRTPTPTPALTNNSLPKVNLNTNVNTNISEHKRLPEPLGAPTNAKNAEPDKGIGPDDVLKMPDLNSLQEQEQARFNDRMKRLILGDE